MQDDLCELRFDIPLPDSRDPRQFERGWRAVLAAQHLTALAMPPAQTVAARFRLCGAAMGNEPPSALTRYLSLRLAALPGSPTVAADQPASSSDWHGVKIWLSYRSSDLTALLQKSKKKSSPTRGRRP